MSTFEGGVPKLAIIDDYLNTSTPHFSRIPLSKLQITTFNDAIMPLNETETSRLVERLRPFDFALKAVGSPGDNAADWLRA
jgi:hypothetical protein